MDEKERTLLHDIATAETKDKLVLEYLDLVCQFTDLERKRQEKVKIRLNEIRKSLNMDKIQYS